MVGHQYVGVKEPAKAIDGAAKVVEELDPVLVVEKDGLLSVASGGDVPQGAGELESKRSCHNETEAPSADGMCQQQN